MTFAQYVYSRSELSSNRVKTAHRGRPFQVLQESAVVVICSVLRSKSLSLLSPSAPPTSLPQPFRMDQGPRAYSLLFDYLPLSLTCNVQHGTCPTCRHDFLPELRPVDSDAESDDDGDYVPTEYEADSDLDTDYEDGLMDSDGIDADTMDIDTLLHVAGGDEATEGDERESIASSHPFPGYHESHDLEAQSVLCGSEAGWWDRGVDGEQNEWGLTDDDSMGTSEGELSVGDRFLGTYHVA